jgi:hypothetical protein
MYIFVHIYTYIYMYNIQYIYIYIHKKKYNIICTHQFDTDFVAFFPAHRGLGLP